MQQCGSPGARWELDTKKLVVCYEIIRELVQLHRNYGQAELVPGTIMMSKNKKVVRMAAKSGPKSRSQKALRADGKRQSKR